MDLITIVLIISNALTLFVLAWILLPEYSPRKTTEDAEQFSQAVEQFNSYQDTYTATFLTYGWVLLENEEDKIVIHAPLSKIRQALSWQYHWGYEKNNKHADVFVLTNNSKHDL